MENAYAFELPPVLAVGGYGDVLVFVEEAAADFGLGAVGEIEVVGFHDLFRGGCGGCHGCGLGAEVEEHEGAVAVG